MASTNSKIGIGALLLLFAAPLYAQSQSDSMQELRQCREHEEPEARLACYDRVAVSTAATESQAAVVEDVPPEPELPHDEPMEDEPMEQESVGEPAAAATPQSVASEEVSEEPESEYAELTDDIGLPKTGDANRPILAYVARCGEANNRKFYFYFDNGQIWQYIGGRRLRYKSCDTAARLTEDGLGFMLQLDGESRRMRVQRVK